jgi:hypothetical protein
MITDVEYYQIVSEVYDLSDYKTKKKVLFCNEAQKNSNIETITNKLYQHIQNKVTGIDFGTIPKSKGVVTRIENYVELNDCIATIRSLIVEYRESPRLVDELSTCLANIQARERIFTKAFALNIDFPIMMYNTSVLAVVSGVSLLISTCVEYVKNGHDSFSMAFDKSSYAKSQEHVLYQFVRQFNAECRNGHLDKAMNEAIKNNMTKMSESTDLENINEAGFAAIAGAVVMAFVTIRALFGVLRRGIYWWLHTRMQVSDWFAIQADFLQINAENLKYRDDDKGEDHKKQVYQKQMKWVERFRKISNAIAITNSKAYKEANKDDEEYSRRREYEDYGDEDDGLF